MSRSTRCPRRAANRASSRSIRRAARWRRAGATTTRSTVGPTTASASFTARFATAGSTVPAGCIPFPSMADRPSRLPCRIPARGRFHPPAIASFTLRRRATSAPRSGTAAAPPISFTFSTWRRMRPRKSAKANAPAATPCGWATPSTTIPTKTATSISTRTTWAAARPRSSPPTRRTMFAGPVPTANRALFTSSTVNCRFSM